MKFNKVLIILIVGFFTGMDAHAGYYNSVQFGDYTIKLNKQKVSAIDVKNNLSGHYFTCPIKKWTKLLSNGAGNISLTSDKKGVLVSPGNKYLKVEDLLACNNNPVTLYSLPYLDDDISAVADVNFEKKLVLALVVMDVRTESYQALVSRFNGRKNLLSGKGFWDRTAKDDSDNPDDTFGMGDTFYLGKISPDGKYVAPNDLDCAADAFPGVWDIEKKRKVLIISDKGEHDIEARCQKMFSGEETLEQVGGKLISSK